MPPDYDTRKNAANLRKHGVGFDAAARLEWDLAITKRDNRADYGEERFISYAPLEGRLHVMVWTPRSTGMRVISLRKANAKERKRYEKETPPSR